MDGKKIIGIILIICLLISLFTWIYGNSIEQGDMSNAGFQVFGFLGTAAFGILTIIYFLILFFKRRKA